MPLPRHLPNSDDHITDAVVAAAVVAIWPVYMLNSLPGWNEPLPGAACKRDILRQLAVVENHRIVKFRVRRIIIPIKAT